MNLPILEAIAIATALVVANNFFTAKLIDLFNASTRAAKTVLSLVGAAANTLALKFFGWQVIVQFAQLFNDAPAFPAEPTIPDPFATIGWILVGVFTWALSGGVVDLGFFKKR